MKAASLLLLIASLILAGCAAPRVPSSDLEISITINVDGQSLNVNIPSGSSVQQALDGAGVTLGSLDRVEPPVYALAQDGSLVSVVRVSESFDTREVTLPFERQTVRNDSLPQGETRLIQEGKNGLQEITTRRVFENGLETSSAIVKAVILQESQPEIVMLGVQTPFTSLPIDGKLVYLSSGNAWLVEGSTANRTPLVTSGDLDGRVLRLSPKGDFLLYTRKSEKPPSEEINTLWVLQIDDSNAKPIDLKVATSSTSPIGFPTPAPRSPTRPSSRAPRPPAGRPTTIFIRSNSSATDDLKNRNWSSSPIAAASMAGGAAVLPGRPMATAWPTPARMGSAWSTSGTNPWPACSRSPPCKPSATGRSFRPCPGEATHARFTTSIMPRRPAWPTPKNHPISTWAPSR